MSCISYRHLRKVGQTAENFHCSPSQCYELRNLPSRHKFALRTVLLSRLHNRAERTARTPADNEFGQQQPTRPITNSFFGMHNFFT